MIPLLLADHYLALAVTWIWRLAQVVAVVLGAWALVSTLRRPDQHFVAADKRTKGFWLAVNAAGLLVVVLMGMSSMFGLLGVVANAVYLADVRPALDYYKPVRVRVRIRRRGPDGRGPGRANGGRR
ncbi:DUF2516 family protein [Actinomyces gerencseriae]|uniref:DUF2516 family protein n=1 Tax=Actinomyces gerencseriae TaxID=52769 RepID=UPI0004214EBC|nr:DUF2516 family protein [Actinomyces gerencseriae]